MVHAVAAIHAALPPDLGSGGRGKMVVRTTCAACATHLQVCQVVAIMVAGFNY